MKEEEVEVLPKYFREPMLHVVWDNYIEGLRSMGHVLIDDEKEEENISSLAKDCITRLD